MPHTPTHGAGLPVLPNAAPAAQATPNIGGAVNPTGPVLTPPATPEAKADLKTRWQEVLAQPETTAALAQFGIEALQPRAPGQTTLGHLGRAFGAGGEAAGRVSATRTAAEKLAEEQEIAREGVAVKREDITAREGIAERRISSAEELSKARIASAEELSKAEREADVDLANLRITSADLRAERGIASDVSLRKVADEKAMERARFNVTELAKAAALEADTKFNQTLVDAFIEESIARNALLPQGAAGTSARQIADEAVGLMNSLKGIREKPGPDRLAAAFNAGASPEATRKLLEATTGTDAAGVKWSFTPEELDAAQGAAAGTTGAGAAAAPGTFEAFAAGQDVRAKTAAAEEVAGDLTTRTKGVLARGSHFALGDRPPEERKAILKGVNNG